MADNYTEEELVARIQEEITDSLGYGDEISKQREKAMEYYYGLPFGNEVEGRSQFIDSTVQDTIEWIKPSLMRVFAAGDDMVKFTPHGPEDVPMATQASDYVNYVFTKDNPGFEILYSWFTDALLSKNGIVKVWWDETEESTREEYYDLTDIEVESIISDDDVDVIQHTEEEREVESAIGQVVETRHDLVIKRKERSGKIKIENVPPSEFLISREAKAIPQARFICHRVRKTLSELREMYPDQDLGPDDLGGDEDDNTFPSERESRFAFDDSSSFHFGSSEPEEALRSYLVHESYLKTDFDGDGIAELRKVCIVGNYVLENDPIDSTPFVSITPIKIPHKFFGLSVADLVMDLQLMKSTLMRNLMDNMYNMNFGRYAVLEGQANLDDLLTQRPGGIVRVKSPNAITPLTTPPLEPYAFQMLEYLDGVRESRAGVSKMSQGMNDNALTSHTTATAVNAVMSAAQSRVELIARNFAETGVKDLMLVIYKLLYKYQDKERMVMLRNEWVPVRPDVWKDKYDCTVSVALGSGNKDQQMMHLSQMLQFAGEAMSGGLRIVNEQNMYNLGSALIKAMGFQNVSDFLTDPSQIPPQPEEPSEAEMEMQVKSKELDIKAAELQLKQQQIQQDYQKLAVDSRLKQEELNLEREQNRAVAIGAT